MSITNPQQISGHSKGNSLTFINKSNPLTRSNVNGTVNTIDYVQWSDWWVDEDLGVLATYYPEVFVMDLLFYCDHVRQSL